MSSICPSCQKRVYFAERIQGGGKDFHKACFKCAQCKKSLQPGNFSENADKLYCKSCYASVIGIKGYGFGNSLDSHVTGGASGSYEASKPKAAPAQAAPAASGGGGGAKFCGNCGATANGAKFCGGCGTAL